MQDVLGLWHRLHLETALNRSLFLPIVTWNWLVPNNVVTMAALIYSF